MLKGKTHTVYMDAKNTISLLEFKNLSKIHDTDCLIQTFAHLLVRHETHLNFLHLPRAQNKLADYLSRNDEQAFQRITLEQGGSWKSSKATLRLPPPNVWPLLQPSFLTTSLAPSTRASYATGEKRFFQLFYKQAYKQQMHFLLLSIL